MIVELHSEASIELATHATWYDVRRPRLGDEFLQELDRALDLIVKRPRAWPRSRLPRARRAGVRQHVLKRFPFTIAYLVMEDTVFVLAIAHMSRPPGYWLGRLEKR